MESNLGRKKKFRFDIIFLWSRLNNLSELSFKIKKTLSPNQNLYFRIMVHRQKCIAGLLLMLYKHVKIKLKIKF